MTLIIDGYNLLHVTGIVGPRSHPATLARSRNALIEFVANSLSPDERLGAQIVFDAANAPRGLPDRFEYRGLTILFARDYEDADEMIEQLIRADHVPRRLTVVSSDHRIQRAARRRKARAVDSDVWYDEILARRETEDIAPPPNPRPKTPLSPHEIETWLAMFGDIDIEKLQREALGRRPTPDPSEHADDVAYESPAKLKDIDCDVPLDNPFPPGYAEDLLKEQEDDENGSQPLS